MRKTRSETGKGKRPRCKRCVNEFTAVGIWGSILCDSLGNSVENTSELAHSRRVGGWYLPTNSHLSLIEGSS